MLNFFSSCVLYKVLFYRNFLCISDFEHYVTFPLRVKRLKTSGRRKPFRSGWRPPTSFAWQLAPWNSERRETVSSLARLTHQRRTSFSQPACRRTSCTGGHERRGKCTPALESYRLIRVFKAIMSFVAIWQRPLIKGKHKLRGENGKAIFLYRVIPLPGRFNRWFSNVYGQLFGKLWKKYSVQ